MYEGDVCLSLASAGNGRRLLTSSLSMSDEILTVQEVAKLLKVADKTVYTMAQRSELPAFKVRGQWRFRRADLDSWIAKQTFGESGKGDLR